MNSRKKITVYFFLFLSSCSAQAQETKRIGYLKSASFDWFKYTGEDEVYKSVSTDSNSYLNPVLAGFYPDPSVCRSGNKYYLVNSSFSFFPGLPIFESTDLVNWKQIGHVISRKEQANLTLVVSKGMYAPTIRYNNGIFYVVCTNVDAGGNFMVTAHNPAGPWSNPIWFKGIDGIDPDIFFDDDGKVYIAHNGPPPNYISKYDGHRAIYIFEYDIKNLKIVGDDKLVINGGTNMALQPVWIEGPHIIKKDGFYYMICAQGGTESNHSEVVFRSKNIFGPYVSYSNNPILTQKHLDKSRKNPVTTTGHADFVELPNGDWWSVFLGTRPYGDYLFNTGRETFMLPVEWKKGWPTIVGGTDPISFSHQRPNLPLSKQSIPPTNGNFVSNDDFDSAELDYKWNFIRTPSKNWYQLKNGKLCIEARDENIQSISNFSFIGRRQQHLNFEVATKMSFNETDIAEAAGLAMFQNEKNYLLFGKRLNANGRSEVFLQQATNLIGNGRPEILKSVTLPQKNRELIFKINGKSQHLNFYYKTDDEREWNLLAEDIDGSILSTKNAGGFVGTYLGMYASKNHF